MQVLHSGISELFVVQACLGAISVLQQRRPPTLRENRKMITMAYAPSSTFTVTQSGFAAVSGFFGLLASKIGRGITAMQIARMRSVVGSMSNDQLRQIGITRGEVYDYAEMLILSETKK